MSGIEIPLHYGVSGRYKFIRMKAIDGPDGTRIPGPVVDETPWNDNIITTNGMNQLMTHGATANSFHMACVVGTGNATPLVSDTGLQSFLIGTRGDSVGASIVRNSTVAPYFVRKTFTSRFDEGVAAGIIAEAGMCRVGAKSAVPDSGTTLFSRGLIVDSGGSPTTITVLSDEFLDVVWEYSIYPPYGVTGTFSQTIDGVATDFDYALGPTGMQSSELNTGWNAGGGGANRIDQVYPFSIGYDAYASGVLSSPGASPSGPAFVATSVSESTYVADSLTKTMTGVWGLANGNVGVSGIGQVRIPFMMGSMAITFDPPIMKVSTKVYSLTVRITIANR